MMQLYLHICSYVIYLVSSSGLSVGLDDVNGSLPDVVAYSGSAYVYFYSDAAYNMTGFDIKYE